MAIIDFPPSPSLFATHSQNGNEWVWTGTTWDIVCETITLPTSSYVGIDPIVVTSSIDGNNNVLVTISHTESGVVAGTYNSVTVDVYGHITSGSITEVPTYGVGQILFGDENGIPTSSTDLYYNTQSGVFQITGSVDITGGVTASLQEGYVWVGDSNGVNVQVPTSSLFDQNNYVRVLEIPASQINFSQPIKPQIVNYINNIGTYDSTSHEDMSHGHLIIDDTDSKWNIVIYYDLETNEITSTTEIIIWFDNSGSMNSTLKPLIDMVATCLRKLLIGIYNNDNDLYNQRVKIKTFSGTDNILPSQLPYITSGGVGDIDRERTFKKLNTTGSSTEITQIINLVFQDEAGGDYYSGTFNGNTSATGTVYTDYRNDVVSLKQTLSNIVNTEYYKGIVYQVQGFSDFKNFLDATTGSLYPSYSGQYGLQDEINAGLINYEYNISAGASSIYYLGLVSQSLSSLGYTNIGDITTINCYGALYGVVQTYCTDYTGNNGNIDVINVVSGSGTGYYFTLNDISITQYETGSGNGASGLSNGSYTVKLYDDDGNVVNLGTYTLNCQALIGTVSVNCDDTSGSSGSIDVIDVSGGTGSPYTFTVGASPTRYSTGVGAGADDVDDGTYSIVLYDSGSVNSVNLGNANVSCYVAPPATNYIINVYECGTCTQIDTGLIAPFGDLGSLTGLYVQLTDNKVGLITGGTSTDSPDYFITGETTFLDCATVPCVG